MKREEKDEMLSGLFMVLTICFGNLFVYAVYVAIEEFSVSYLFIALAFGIVFTLFAFWTYVKTTHKSLRFCFIPKKVLSEIEKSAEIFSVSPDFQKKYINFAKSTYQRTGKIYEKEQKIFEIQDLQKKESTIEVFELLLKSIESKGGFVEFFTETEKRKNDEKYINEFDVNSYMFLKDYLCGELVSKEFSYLAKIVYKECQFVVTDIGFSKEFTEKNNKMIEKLNNFYSPILFVFHDEIKNLAQKWKTRNHSWFFDKKHIV